MSTTITTTTQLNDTDSLFAAKGTQLIVLPAEPPQLPSLTIEEQPTQFYRFRYESEVEKDSSRVGGLLHGRNSTDGNKTFTKVRISGIDPAVHLQLHLIVCTVSAEEKAPHPYYLHGDNCRDGYFELKKLVDLTFKGSELEVIFNRLAVICVPKKSQKDIDRALDFRIKHVPPLPEGVSTTSIKYDSRNLGSIRLAFSLQFTDTVGHTWWLNTVYSDVIAAEKQKKSISIECLNPSDVPMKGGSLVAISTRTPTTGISKSDVKIHLYASHADQQTVGKLEPQTGLAERNATFVYPCTLVDIKKHLLVVKIPDMTSISKNDRLKCKLSVRSNGFKSEDLELILSKNFNNDRPGSLNPRKRQRTS